jgi:hypothetical protein
MASVSAGFVAAKASVISFLAGLGPIGAIALGATVAIGALTAAFAIFSRSSNNAKKVTEEQKEAEELTTAAAQTRLETIAQEQADLLELIEIRTKNGQSSKDLRDQYKDLNAENDGLVTAIESGATAINDIAEAEAMLAEQRTTAALEAGSDAAALAKLQQQITEANTEELQEIIKTLENRKEVLEAERNALQETGDQSEETLNRIEQLNDGIGDIDEQLERAGSSASRATAAEKTLSQERETNAKQAEKDAVKEQQAATKRLQQQAKERQAAAQQQQAAIQKAVDADNQARQKAIDTQKQADEDLLQLQEDFNKATNEAFIDARRDEAKQTRAGNRDRLDILKEVSRQEQDLIAAGDIFAIADIREKASDDLADLRDDFDFDARERQIQRRNEANDRLREAVEQRRKLRENAIAQLNDMGQGTRAIRTGWRSMLTGLGEDLSKFSQALIGGGVSAAGRLPTVAPPGAQNIGLNVSIDGAPIRAIAQQEIGALA